MAEKLESPSQAPPEIEQTYGGYSRFEIELEFVQSLANPMYLNHLASQKFLQQPAFIEYLGYLQYWSKPPYLKYLTYPGPTLRNLELLQQERFRTEILGPELVQRMIDEGMSAAVEWHKES
ncbi:Mediator of RNA polymerase II transcription subunit 31 [Ceratocystis fimbriata CBS 114723]|uniref:Mediator of RNA polymerase II transcription subunit 31 n=2 Tax=Ceratocystis TaxID=5157 RepID=A0A0F8AYF8_CERFI|nr:Mediator of RNA polymerase II transcription subunit 31 [Ceratocystis platani]PHH55044.1 Mediator of RNA polymerase II transcription subunit 31 [Ceratocystis fimbriata CBS 114723]